MSSNRTPMNLSQVIIDIIFHSCYRDKGFHGIKQADQILIPTVVLAVAEKTTEEERTIVGDTIGNLGQPIIGSLCQLIISSRCQLIIGSQRQPIIGSLCQLIIGSLCQPIIGSLCHLATRYAQVHLDLLEHHHGRVSPPPPHSITDKEFNKEGSNQIQVVLAPHLPCLKPRLVLHMLMKRTLVQIHKTQDKEHLMQTLRVPAQILRTQEKRHWLKETQQTQSKELQKVQIHNFPIKGQGPIGIHHKILDKWHH